jgi:hypothetical protein
VKRRVQREVFPAPLREFREEDWPPVEGECLGHYTCRGRGYEEDCTPREGESCGQRCYESLARDYADRPGLLPARKRQDAYTRFRNARLGWLGKDHPLYVEEFIDGLQADERMSREGWGTWPGNLTCT